MALEYTGHIILSWLTFLSQVAIGLFVLVLVTGLYKKSFFSKLILFAQKHAVGLSFLVALVSTGGSLYYSEIIGFEPCRLCWYQRILMYPQVLLIGTALLKKRKDIFTYLAPLCILGLLISGYHYGIQTLYSQGVGVSDSCNATGTSCVSSEFLELNYITIPLMAFTGFLLILVLTLLRRKMQAIDEKKKPARA